MMEFFTSHGSELVTKSWEHIYITGIYYTWDYCGSTTWLVVFANTQDG